MNASTLNDTILLGALSGMRSMAGPAALAFHEGSPLKRVVSLLAASEMAADKTSVVGDRIDPLPLAGRAAMGALVGAVVAKREHGNVLAAAVVGAAAAVAVAHLAYRVRTRLPVNSSVGGVLEDAIVIGIGSVYASRMGKGERRKR
jgi:uncharacterized membrane protein